MKCEIPQEIKSNEQLHQDFVYLLSVLATQNSYPPARADPTFYKTGSYQGDVEIYRKNQELIDRYVHEDK